MQLHANQWFIAVDGLFQDMGSIIIEEVVVQVNFLQMFQLKDRLLCPQDVAIHYSAWLYMDTLKAFFSAHHVNQLLEGTIL